VTLASSPSCKTIVLSCNLRLFDADIDTKTNSCLVFRCLHGLSVVNLDGVLVRCIQMASDIFAKIGDIKGESLDDKHKDEIEVLSFSWGVANAANIGGGGGGGAGRATFHDLSFTHTIDAASPKLLQVCATGTHLKEATITHRKAGKGQQEYLIIKMNDIIITGVSLGDSTGGAGSENVSLAFAKVDLEYKRQNPNGTLEPGIHFKFDIKANKDG
jgi:type VI secretion system secreted protein Hcp